MVLFFFLLAILFLIYILTVLVLFNKGKKISGIIALIMGPALIVLCFFVFYIFILSYNPSYDGNDAKDDLIGMGFNIRDEVIVTDTEYYSGLHDESRYTKIVVSSTDKANMIQSIKNAPNYSFKKEAVGDSINTGFILSNKSSDTLFERKYENRNISYTIRSISIYSHSDTIRYVIEKP